MKPLGIATLSAVGIFALSGFANAQVSELNSIRAAVNGEVITGMEVDTAIQTQIQLYLMQNQGRVTKAEMESEIKKMQGRALEDLIERKLILSKFKEMGGEIKDHIVTESVDRFVKERFDGDQGKFLEELKKTGMTFPQFRKVQAEQIAVQALRGRNSLNPDNEQIINTPLEVEQEYERIKSDFADDPKINLRMLSVGKEGLDKSADQQKQLINDLRKKLLNGESDFGTLAKEHSVDSFASAGGSVGLIDRNVLNEKITNFVFDLPSGKVSEVFDDGIYWRLFKVDSKVGGKAPPLSAVRDQVDKRLTSEKRKANFERWISQLRRDANIRIYNQD